MKTAAKNIKKKLKVLQSKFEKLGLIPKNTVKKKFKTIISARSLGRPADPTQYRIVKPRTKEYPLTIHTHILEAKFKITATREGWQYILSSSIREN